MGARGRFLVLSPLATSPDLSLDLLLLLSGGPPRLPTRISLPTTLERGRQPSTPLVSPPLAALTTPSATSPPWCPSATSTLPATLPVSVLLSAPDTPTAKHQGAENTLTPTGQILHLDKKYEESKLTFSQ